MLIYRTCTTIGKNGKHVKIASLELWLFFLPATLKHNWLTYYTSMLIYNVSSMQYEMNEAYKRHTYNLSNQSAWWTFPCFSFHPISHIYPLAGTKLNPHMALISPVFLLHSYQPTTTPSGASWTSLIYYTPYLPSPCGYRCIKRNKRCELSEGRQY